VKNERAVTLEGRFTNGTLGAKDIIIRRPPYGLEVVKAEVPGAICAPPRSPHTS
jgi:hypothetical protein